jgi:hypothetical protein
VECRLGYVNCLASKILEYTNQQHTIFLSVLLFNCVKINVRVKLYLYSKLPLGYIKLPLGYIC